MVTFRSCGHCRICLEKKLGKVPIIFPQYSCGKPRLFVVFPGDKPFVAEARGFFVGLEVLQSDMQAAATL